MAFVRFIIEGFVVEDFQNGKHFRMVRLAGKFTASSPDPFFSLVSITWRTF